MMLLVVFYSFKSVVVCLLSNTTRKDWLRRIFDFVRYSMIKKQEFHQSYQQPTS